MIKIHELTNKTVRSQVEYQNQVIEFDYYPNRLTFEFLSQNPEALEQITHLIKWWSIEDDNGEVNIEETAKQLPVQLLTLILEKVVSELSLKTQKN